MHPSITTALNTRQLNASRAQRTWMECHQGILFTARAETLRHADDKRACIYWSGDQNVQSHARPTITVSETGRQSTSQKIGWQVTLWVAEREAGQPAARWIWKKLKPQDRHSAVFPSAHDALNAAIAYCRSLDPKDHPDIAVQEQCA